MSNGVEDESAARIIIPGPELRPKIDKAAASLSSKETSKAEVLMAKVLASPKGGEFAFFDKTHIFYPFFLSRLNENRRYPELATGGAKEKPNSGNAASPPSDNGSGKAEGSGMKGTQDKKDGDAAGAAGAAAASTTTDGGIVRREGGSKSATGEDEWRNDVLQSAEKEARKYLEDPFPDTYSLNLQHGTVFISSLVMDFMTGAAQYTAKHGEPFLAALRQTTSRNPHMRFLTAEDPRNATFNGLVSSYKTILSTTPEQAEERLERCCDPDYILNVMCAEKTKYVKASIARRKASMLTDQSLRSKLEWDLFTTIHEFSLSDLGLSATRPEKVLLPLPHGKNGSTKNTSGRSLLHAPTGSAQGVGFRRPGGPSLLSLGMRGTGMGSTRFGRGYGGSSQHGRGAGFGTSAAPVASFSGGRGFGLSRTMNAAKRDRSASGNTQSPSRRGRM